MVIMATMVVVVVVVVVMVLGKDDGLYFFCFRFFVFSDFNFFFIFLTFLGPLCSVSLCLSGTVARGKEDFVTFIDGAKYMFADARAKEQFDASPWLYVEGAGEPPVRLLVVAAGMSITSQYNLLTTMYHVHY